MGSFDAALSALQAYSNAMDVVGNNLANMSTTGFKTSEISFQDVMGAVTTDTTQIGNGVKGLPQSPTSAKAESRPLGILWTRRFKGTDSFC